MPDEQQGQIEEAMPTSEPVVDEKEALENSKNPERTAAYIKKLQEENRRLKEQQDRPSILEEMNPGGSIQQPPKVDLNQFSNLNQQQVSQLQDDFTFVGEDGIKYIDQSKLQQALKSANERASKAEQSARIAADEVRKYEETRQVRETYKDFPQLNPNNVDAFDENFYELVKGELMKQAMRGEKDLMKAAREVDKRLSTYKGQAAKQEASQKAQAQKEQINATGSAQPRSSYSSNDDLVMAVRKGQPGALAERLRRSGF